MRPIAFDVHHTLLMVGAIAEKQTYTPDIMGDQECGIRGRLELLIDAALGAGILTASKKQALVRPFLQGFDGGQPPTSTRRVYTVALLAVQSSQAIST